MDVILIGAACLSRLTKSSVEIAQMQSAAGLELRPPQTSVKARVDTEVSVINHIITNQPVSLHLKLNFIFRFGRRCLWIEIGDVDLPVPCLSQFAKVLQQPRPASPRQQSMFASAHFQAPPR